MTPDERVDAIITDRDAIDWRAVLVKHIRAAQAEALLDAAEWCEYNRSRHAATARTETIRIHAEVFEMVRDWLRRQARIRK